LPSPFGSILLPDGKVVSTGYGVRWPDEGRDGAYYQRVAEAVRFGVMVQSVVGQHVVLELEKP